MGAVAVHEFGHALGFSHEQNRPEAHPGYVCSPQGENGNVEYGAWDINSVMNYCNPVWNGGGILSTTDIAGLRAFYGPFTITCPGPDSTCEDVTLEHAIYDLSPITASSAGSSRYAMNGYGTSFSTTIGFMLHTYWNVNFTAANPLELPTDDPDYDFTGFAPNQNTGCIAHDAMTGRDSIAKRDLQHGGSCENIGLDYGAQGYPRYLSTHYNRDPLYHDAETSWRDSPTDNQPIVMQATSNGDSVYMDILQIRVKYGFVDVYSDTLTGDGVVDTTPTLSQLGPGSHNVQIWSATKVVFTAAGSGNSISTGFDAAAVDAVVIGQP